MKIAVGLNFFLEAQNLKRCLDSLRGFDHVICVDGKYPQFLYWNLLSDDGSVEILKKYPNVKYVGCPADQITKRNTYLEEAGKIGCDFILSIDADMYVEIDWSLFRTELERAKKSDHIVFNVEMNDAGYIWHPAGLLKLDGLVYHDLHFITKHQCGFEQSWLDSHYSVKGITIHHHQNPSPVHLKGKKKYRMWKQPYENELRRKRGLPEIVGREA